MAKPELKEMLAHAQKADAEIAKYHVQIGKAIISVPPPASAPIPPVSEIALIDEDDDPFGGNVNNRKVAQRIAGMNRKIFHNAHPITHMGDPTKAARDVAKSLEVNPDAMSDGDIEKEQQRSTAELLAKNPPKALPTPGSPAAERLKAGETPQTPSQPTTAPQGGPAAPPTWGTPAK